MKSIDNQMYSALFPPVIKYEHLQRVWYNYDNKSEYRNDTIFNTFYLDEPILISICLHLKRKLYEIT